MRDLADYLPYLVNRAGARMAVSFERDIRPLGATLQQWRVLAALRETDGLRLGALAERTSINLSTLSRLLDGMAARGLCLRSVDPEDTRSVRIMVSPAGRVLTERILPIAERYEARALDGFSDDEVATLKSLLKRVYRNMAES